jgi:thymidylate kinase
VRELNQEQIEELRECCNHPGWTLYLDVIEDLMLDNFQQLFALDPGEAESFVKFVELKGRLDQLRDVTYFYQRQLATGPEEVERVDNTYSSVFKRLLGRLFGRS